MSLTGLRSIILNLPFDVAFRMLGSKIAEQIGATPLLYAALAYFVFDESFFLEDLSDHYPELESDLNWWLEDFYSDFHVVLEDLRHYYATPLQDVVSHRPNLPYRLVKVQYIEPDEALLVSASTDESDNRFGSQWHIPNERSESHVRYGDELRGTFRISGRSGLCMSEGSPAISVNV